MQIVIDINNELYEYFSKRRTMHDDGYFSHVGKLIKALRDGIILPEGHGRLIDADERRKEIDEKDRWVVDLADTIIEADKTEK